MPGGCFSEVSKETLPTPNTLLMGEGGSVPEWPHIVTGTAQIYSTGGLFPQCVGFVTLHSMMRDGMVV